MTSAGPLATADLHSHSTASDGALPPATVIEAAARAGLAVLALTDHDTLAGVSEAKAAGDRLGVRVVPGVELSASEGEGEIHILALHVEWPDRIEVPLERFRMARSERAARMVERLNTLGVPVTLDAVLAEAGGGAVGRPHVARAMVKGGWVADLRDAFDRWLADGRPAYIEKHRLSVGDAIELAHASGALAVLAHPGPDGTRARLDALAGLGLDGVEVRHPSHTPDDVARLTALAEHIGLLPSGGSDFHGAAEGARSLGRVRIPIEWVERQEERLRSHRRSVSAA